MYLMKIFQKGGGGGIGEVLKFVTLDESLRNKKNFCVFCKNDSILRPFLVKQQSAYKQKLDSR